MISIVHHIELWTHDLAQVDPAFGWLFDQLGFTLELDPAWPLGRIWRHPEGPYVVLEQSPALINANYERRGTGLNHLAFRVSDRPRLDAIHQGAPQHGWEYLYPDVYPEAGGPGSYADYLVNAQGFEVELVAE